MPVREATQMLIAPMLLAGRCTNIRSAPAGTTGLEIDPRLIDAQIDLTLRPELRGATKACHAQKVASR